MERTLIERAKARDGEAVAELVTDLNSLIHATIRRYQPYATDKDNLLGEAYYILLLAVDSYDPTRGVPFHLYFQHRFRYFLLDDLKRKTHFESYPIEDYAYLASEDDVAFAVEETLDREWLKTNINCLSPREKDVVTLFYEGDLSLSEIAGFLGCSYQTVANTKLRAIKKLRRLYAAG